MRLVLNSAERIALAFAFFSHLAARDATRCEETNGKPAEMEDASRSAERCKLQRKRLRVGCSTRHLIAPSAALGSN